MHFNRSIVLEDIIPFLKLIGEHFGVDVKRNGDHFRVSIISGSIQGDHFSVGDHFGVDLGIISGSIWGSFQGWGSFRGRFGDHFRAGDHFGVGIINFRELYSAMTSNPESLRTTGNEAAKVSVPAFSNLRSGVILFYFFSASLAREGKRDIKG